jgi:hypothetical protein
MVPTETISFGLNAPRWLATSITCLIAVKSLTVNSGASAAASAGAAVFSTVASLIYSDIVYS